MTDLTDTFGRTVRKLRLSVTDQCNLRCTYCMPEEGLTWLQRQELLSYEELRRLAAIMVDHGVRHIRITGGEPLMRKDLDNLVSRLDSLRCRGLESINMTTNGILLDRHAPALKKAGLDGVNISLDTLNASLFEKITRRDQLAVTLESLTLAADVWPNQVKVNAVLERGINDHEALKLADYCGDVGVTLRFIEKMPLGAGESWAMEQVITGEQLRTQFAKEGGLQPQSAPRGASPSARWQRDNGQTLGFIDSVSEPFCASCDRVRLTSDGALRTCLFATSEVDLKGPMRAGASDGELLDLIQSAITAKEAGHLINRPGFVPPDRSISQVGG